MDWKSTARIGAKVGKASNEFGFLHRPLASASFATEAGLNATQLAVLMHLCDFWWKKDSPPYPSLKTLAERLSLSERQVRRHIADMENAGMLQRVERTAGHGGKMTNLYDLWGLVEKPKRLEPDFSDVEVTIKLKHAAVSRRGYRRSKKAEPRAHTVRQRRVRGEQHDR